MQKANMRPSNSDWSRRARLTSSRLLLLGYFIYFTSLTSSISHPGQVCIQVSATLLAIIRQLRSTASRIQPRNALSTSPQPLHHNMVSSGTNHLIWKSRGSCLRCRSAVAHWLAHRPGHPVSLGHGREQAFSIRQRGYYPAASALNPRLNFL